MIPLLGLLGPLMLAILLGKHTRKVRAGTYALVALIALCIVCVMLYDLFTMQRPAI
jgi:hypothetical protein